VSIPLAETRYLTDLVKGVRATMLVSDLEPKVQRQITNKATAVKLFAEAGFRSEAKVILDELKGAYAEDRHQPVITRLADRLTAHWRVSKVEV
jgi:ribose 5-phosphate isomerase RpiB